MPAEGVAELVAAVDAFVAGRIDLAALKAHLAASPVPDAAQLLHDLAHADARASGVELERRADR